MTIYEADWVCPVSSAPIRDGAIAVENGRIAKVGTSSEMPAGDRTAFPGCIIIPGFVNAHTHLELTLFHGLLDSLSFPDWIAKLVRIKYGALTSEALKLSARLGAIEMLQAGVTAVGEVMDTGAGWEAMREFGLQGVAYQEVFGPADAAAGEAMAKLQSKVEAHRRHETETQRIGISPHAPYTVSKTLYEQARDFARAARLRMTAHIAESEEETRFVRDGKGGFAEAHGKRGIAVTPRRCLPVAYLDSLGLLGPDMLLIHAIETDGADLARIRETGAFVVHCPRSNAKLGHRVARVGEMRGLGVPVALGTDSPASNDSIDMFEEMRMAVEQQGLRAEEVLRMATIEGARALGMDGSLGSLERGKRADFVVVELGSSSDPVAAMLKTASRSGVKEIFLSGKTNRVDDSVLRQEIQRIQQSVAGL